MSLLLHNQNDTSAFIKLLADFCFLSFSRFNANFFYSIFGFISFTPVLGSESFSIYTVCRIVIPSVGVIMIVQEQSPGLCNMLRLIYM